MLILNNIQTQLGEPEEAAVARALKILGGQVEKTDVFTLSNGDSRSIIVIRKVSVTPAKYPRGKGKERSAPIV